MSYAMLIWIQIFSCLVLADGCRRLYVFLKKNAPYDINNKAVCFHVGVYMLYLIGLFYFYFTFIVDIGSDGKNKFLI